MERFKEFDAAGMPIDQTEVPTGLSHSGPPVFRKIAERKNTIVHWSDHYSPSDMVAMAQPGVLVSDIWEFFRKFR